MDYCEFQCEGDNDACLSVPLITNEVQQICAAVLQSCLAVCCTDKRRRRRRDTVDFEDAENENFRRDKDRDGFRDKDGSGSGILRDNVRLRNSFPEDTHIRIHSSRNAALRGSVGRRIVRSLFGVSSDERKLVDETRRQILRKTETKIAVSENKNEEHNNNVNENDDYSNDNGNEGDEDNNNGINDDVMQPMKIEKRRVEMAKRLPNKLDNHNSHHHHRKSAKASSSSHQRIVPRKSLNIRWLSGFRTCVFKCKLSTCPPKNTLFALHYKRCRYDVHQACTRTCIRRTLFDFVRT